MRGPMTSSHRSRSKTTSPVQSEVAAAEVLAWVSDCIQGGLCFICNGVLIFENSHFAELIEAAEPLAEGLEREHQLRKSLLDEAVAWNRQPLGSKMVSGYRLQDRHGHALHYECRFNVLPYRSERGVLMVVEDVTERTLLAQEAAQAACFQSVLARIGTLAVSGASAQTLMNEAVRQTAAALEVALGFDQLEELDVVVRDLERGLIDFPSMIDGEEVYLCWLLDEPEVVYWHAPESGFGGRRRL